MTDARFPERWLVDRRFLRLTHHAHHLYVTGLLFSIGNRSDGVIESEDLALIPGGDLDLRYMPATPPEPVLELEKAGLWRRQRDRWVIVDYLATQTTSHELEVLENVRRREREKKARQREKSSMSRGTVPGDIRKGRQVRQEGQAGHEEKPITEIER